MSDIVVRELTPDTWDDWLEVMGPRGGEAGCFCTYYRQTSKEAHANRGAPNRDLARRLVEEGRMPGLIAYREGRPVGWVQVGPRELYPRLDRSRVSKRLDDRAAWAVTCFVVPREHRRSGVATTLLEAAVELAREHGAETVEGYPMTARSDDTPPIWAWMGFAGMFDACGFDEVARPTPTRPYMRRDV